MPEGGVWDMTTRADDQGGVERREKGEMNAV